MHTLVAPVVPHSLFEGPTLRTWTAHRTRPPAMGRLCAPRTRKTRQGSYMPTVELGDGLLSLQLVGVGHKGAAARLAVVVAQDVQLHYLPQGQEDLLQVPLGGLPKQTLSALCASRLLTCMQAGYQRPYVHGSLSRDLDRFHQGRHVCDAAVLVYWLHAWAAPRWTTCRLPAPAVQRRHLRHEQGQDVPPEAPAR